MTRVLVVDDEPQIRKALSVNLTARGYTVDVAASGEEALARLRAAQRRYRPTPDEPVIVADAFRIDLAQKTITATGGGLVHLIPIEWAIVEALVRHSGRLITQRQLLRRCRVRSTSYRFEPDHEPS